MKSYDRIYAEGRQHIEFDLKMTGVKSESELQVVNIWFIPP